MLLSSTSSHNSIKLLKVYGNRTQLDQTICQIHFLSLHLLHLGSQGCWILSQLSSNHLDSHSHWQPILSCWFARQNPRRRPTQGERANSTQEDRPQTPAGTQPTFFAVELKNLNRDTHHNKYILKHMVGLRQFVIAIAEVEMCMMMNAAHDNKNGYQDTGEACI